MRDSACDLYVLEGGELRQEDFHKFKASLCYIVRPPRVIFCTLKYKHSCGPVESVPVRGLL